MAADDYYKILGVGRDAGDEEIKKAYRKLAHQYHPDKKEGDEKRFKQVSEAYRVLSDKQKRAQYDRFGKTFSAQGGPASGWDFSGFQNGNFDGFGNVEDIFEQFFGGRTRTKERRQPRGENLQINVSLSLEQAYSGIEKELRYKTFVRCNLCSGDGSERGVDLNQCKECRGSGELRENKSSFFGTFSQISVCVSCHGRGKVPEKFCKECKGVGRKLEEKNIKVEIHKGVEDGQLIKISEAGEAGVYGGEIGDLFVRVDVAEHKVFERKGPHLLIEKDVEAADFILGNTIKVETISGKEKKIHPPEKVSFGEPIRLRGEGMPIFGRSGFGDLFVKINFISKKKLSKEAKKALEDL